MSSGDAAPVGLHPDEILYGELPASPNLLYEQHLSLLDQLNPAEKLIIKLLRDDLQNGLKSISYGLFRRSHNVEREQTLRALTTLSQKDLAQKVESNGAHVWKLTEMGEHLGQELAARSASH